MWAEQCWVLGALSALPPSHKQPGQGDDRGQQTHHREETGLGTLWAFISPTSQENPIELGCGHQIRLSMCCALTMGQHCAKGPLTQDL